MTNKVDQVIEILSEDARLDHTWYPERLILSIPWDSINAAIAAVGIAQEPEVSSLPEIAAALGISADDLMSRLASRHGLKLDQNGEGLVDEDGEHIPIKGTALREIIDAAGPVEGGRLRHPHMGELPGYFAACQDCGKKGLSIDNNQEERGFLRWCVSNRVSPDGFEDLPAISAALSDGRAVCEPCGDRDQEESLRDDAEED